MPEEQKRMEWKIGRLILCADENCHAMFTHLPDNWGKPNNLVPLPCGHRIGSVIFSGSIIKTAMRAEEMLQWLDSNGLILSEADMAVRLAGGCLEYGNTKLAVPSRNLTEDEQDGIAGI